ncbi:hypothetical protein GWI33_010143 [Rhynchophorus ferrugineus]|uniref:Fringe-like glycosyltransferase domain-containing protein n=1 Tax=Rhynchophorus ferrugineus TaxID=354439 RepID=A0A834IV96_RHYFE|nr:hypothetical protein GWI33_010143 [Rhynchophorus ferrugineus]
MKYYVFLTVFYFSYAVGLSNVTYVILSQADEFHKKVALQLQNSIYTQSKELNLINSEIYISTIDFNISGEWTIFPIISPILEVIRYSQWVVLLEDRCNINLNLLLNTLQKYDSEKEIWLGHAIFDNEATIIHHFGFYKNPTFFKYPNLASGIILSIPLLKRLKHQLDDGNYKMPDFHIDPAYEFALFVYNNGSGPMIHNETTLCHKEQPNCSIYPKKLVPCVKSYVSSIFYAVKTCEKFHDSRVKTVQKTWGQYCTKITFFSDVEDIKALTVAVGVKNTEHGHCEKTITILKLIEKEIQDDVDVLWVALVDDDTILSVSRLTNLTSCYNTKEPIILGERYRFGDAGDGGFDYTTGGAGTLINRAALNLLAHNCKCPKLDSPDDMILGVCAEKLGITLVHIPQMHQARPSDYAEGRLATMDAVTFHKHWMINPIEVYQDWFEEDDRKYIKGYYEKLEL